MQYRRITVNVPAELAEMIEARVAEIPYRSESSYFLALALFDCWSRREHKMTAKLMSQPPKVRDAVFSKIAEEFKQGIEPEKQSWFDHFLNGLVKKEIEKGKQDLKGKQPEA